MGLFKIVGGIQKGHPNEEDLKQAEAFALSLKQHHKSKILNGRDNMKTLLVYGTRYGATAGTSEEIAKVLQAEGLEVKVVNAKEEKIKDISPYELIIVGSWHADVEGGQVKPKIS